MAFKGDKSLLLSKSKFVAIIGTRKATRLELKASYILSQKLVDKGYIIVSGLASGVDTEAHKGAIEGNGKTIAILSTSLSEAIYPKENTTLSKEIAEKGLIVFPYSEDAIWEKGFGQPQKRLIERDILVAHFCPKIIVVSDKELITGGSAWALNYGHSLGKEIWRLDSNFKFHREPGYEKKSIWWDMELDLSIYD